MTTIELGMAELTIDAGLQLHTERVIDFVSITEYLFVHVYAAIVQSFASKCRTKLRWIHHFSVERF